MPGRPTLLLGLLILSASPAFAVRPLRAPPVFATFNHVLTFRTPAGASYCPLPRDWVGTDHGTMLFLEPPRRCGAEGSYLSISRDFAPEVPRIEVFYGFSADDNPSPLPHCPGAPVQFLGQPRSLCVQRQNGRVTAEIRTYYLERMAVVTLHSFRAREIRDLALFRRFAASFSTCTAVWPGTHGRPPTRDGEGPRCPRGRWF